jgi:hypothetical protein
MLDAHAFLCFFNVYTFSFFLGGGFSTESSNATHTHHRKLIFKAAKSGSFLRTGTNNSPIPVTKLF